MTSPHWAIIVATVIFLMIWFGATLTSPMMFAGPGALYHKGLNITVLSVVHSPLVVFGLYWLMQWTFLGVHPAWVLGFFTCLIVGGCYKIGYYDFTWLTKNG
ncbi:hypothetical protein [Shewanella waksmanii]|uniref:hypothetical protein n=1 Tax=Shewanella waksmanii TaxID=213783 RepID=UPI003735C3C1